MKSTMDMSSERIEQAVIEIEYGEEILSAGWNPAVELVFELLQVPNEEQMIAAADLVSLNSAEDISAGVSEIFLKKMYAYQD